MEKRTIAFYAVALAMCHTLELIFNAESFTRFYLIGLMIYLFAFTIIWKIITYRDFNFWQLWGIGAAAGFAVEVVIVREILGAPLLIVSVFFWGFLYTAVNYTIVKRAVK